MSYNTQSQLTNTKTSIPVDSSVNLFNYETYMAFERDAPKAARAFTLACKT